MTTHNPSIRIYPDGNHLSQREAGSVVVEKIAAGSSGIFLSLSDDVYGQERQKFVYLSPKDATNIALDILANLREMGYDLNGEETND